MSDFEKARDIAAKDWSPDIENQYAFISGANWAREYLGKNLSEPVVVKDIHGQDKSCFSTKEINKWFWGD